METSVIYYIDDELTPFLTKIPIPPQKVTLSDFKKKLGRVNYNFFFKSTQRGFGDVKEEVVDDSARLPSHDGSVVAWLRSLGCRASSYARDSKPFNEPTNDRERLAEQKKDTGNSFYKKQNYKDALSFYDEAVNLCPGNPAYHGNKAAAYMMMGTYKQAVEAAQRAVALDCTFTKGYVRLAKCCLALGDIGGCEEAIRRATELGGPEAAGTERRALDSLRTLRDDSQKHIDMADYRRVIYCMNRCLEYSPACPRTKLIKAECLALIGRISESMDIVSDLLRSDSSDPDVIYVRGLCFYLEENYEQTFKHFQNALRLSPDHSKAQIKYKMAKKLKQKKEDGNRAFKMGRWQEALNLFNEALIIDTTNIVVNAKLYFNKALACANLNHIREAIEACTASIQLNDNFPKAYRKRAMCYAELELLNEAVKDYERLYALEKTEENKKALDQAKLAMKVSRRKDPYKILGVQSTASEEEINRAYRKRGMIEKELLEHERRLKEMGEAHATLSDPRKRARYDRGLYVDNEDSS